MFIVGHGNTTTKFGNNTTKFGNNTTKFGNNTTKFGNNTKLDAAVKKKLTNTTFCHLKVAI